MSTKAKFQFAFSPHRRGDPYWLTDGHGNEKKVHLPTWLYYRATRQRRQDCFNALRREDSRVS